MRPSRQTWIIPFCGLAVLCGAQVALAETRVIGEVGRAREAFSRDPEYWRTLELDDWKSPSTGTTVLSESRCGLALTYRLIGTRRRNYVMVEAQAGPRIGGQVLDLAKVRMTFGSGVERVAAFAEEPAPIEIKADDKLTVALAFPDKRDFRNQGSVRIRLPFSACAAEVEFRRPQGSLSGQESHTIWSRMQLGMELGAGLAKVGELDAVAESGVAFGLSVTRYPWMSHGFWLGFRYEDLGTAADASGLAVFLGYSYRRYLTGRLSFHYELAPGVYQYALAGQQGGIQSLWHAFALGQRIGFDYVFVRLTDFEILESDHGVGILLSDDWLPNARFAGVSAAGRGVAFEVRYIFGN